MNLSCSTMRAMLALVVTRQPVARATSAGASVVAASCFAAATLWPTLVLGTPSAASSSFAQMRSMTGTVPSRSCWTCASRHSSFVFQLAPSIDPTC